MGGHEAQGPARQIVPDDHWRTDLSVRDAYQECSQRARARNAQRKLNSLRGLVTGDGQAVEFTETARQQLPPQALQAIRSVAPARPRLSAVVGVLQAIPPPAFVPNAGS